jgi:hypothetical protein
VPHDHQIHQGLLEQRLDRLQRHIQHLSDEVAGVEAIKATSSQPSAVAVRELEYSLRAEILRLQHELDECEAQLRRSREQLAENRRPNEQ